MFALNWKLGKWKTEITGLLVAAIWTLSPSKQAISKSKGSFNRSFYFEENSVENNFNATAQFQKAVIVIIIRDIPTMLHFRFFFIIILCYSRKWEESNDSSTLLQQIILLPCQIIHLPKETKFGLKSSSALSTVFTHHFCLLMPDRMKNK